MTSRIFSLHGRKQRLSVDALLFNTSENLTSINVRFLTGFTGSDASVLITPEERHFFTDGRYKTQAGQETSGYGVHVVKRKIEALARTFKRLKVKRLGIEGSRVSHDFVAALAKKAPNVAMVPLARAFLEGLRIHKSPAEKKSIAEAAELASSCCRAILDKGLVGKHETDVALDLETAFRIRQAEGTAIDTIVAANSSAH